MAKLKAFKEPKKLNKDIMAKIKQRRLQILVHSCIYYRFDQNIVDDYTYNKWALELAHLQAKYPEESRAVKEYYQEFKAWQGEQCGSGFNLPYCSPDIVGKAEYLLRLKGLM